MIVIIRDIYYHNFTFEVKDTDTIITLKVMIEFKTGTSPCSQRLVCNFLICKYLLKLLLNTLS